MSTVVRYSHQAFLSVINKKPKDFTSRGAYADWLEENDPASVGPKTLELLRDPNQNVWVHRTPEGKVVAGKRWTMPEIKAANKAAGGHWFKPQEMRFFGTRVLPKHVYSGPGGVYFVHEGDNYNRTQREYRIAHFEPHTGSTGSWSTYHSDPSTGRDFAPNDAHADVNDAVELARQLAAGTSPYPKNSYWNEAKHGAAVEPPTPHTPPAQMSRLPRRRVVVEPRRYSATPTDLAGLFRAAREDPHEPTRHAVIADALDEAYPGNRVSGLIRRQYGFGEHGGKGGQENIHHYPFGRRSLRLSLRRSTPIGEDGPFTLRLEHQDNPTGESPRWIVHATVPSPQDGEGQHFGYAFEFPHEEAHLIPRMFPGAAAHIGWADVPKLGVAHNSPEWKRQFEADRFNDRMDEQERNA